MSNPDGYIKVELGYEHVIVPLEDGLNIIRSLRHAETYEHPYGESEDIVPYTGNKVRFELMTEQKYNEIKAKQLLTKE